MDAEGDRLKINACCGRHVLEGWTNVDVVPSTHKKARGKVPEILADARSVPLPDGCADEIMCIHGFEHFYPWEASDLLREWLRLLRPGGVLVLEMPDVIKCAENLISGFALPGKDPLQFNMWGLYGDPGTKDPFMMHKWGWHPASLRQALKQHGFADIADESPQWHAAGSVRRDMRMTARKP